MEELRAVSALLENYWARDQVFRNVQFSSALFSGLLERKWPLLAEKLLKISAAISNMRVMLRLLDDIPSLAYVLSTWNEVQVNYTVIHIYKVMLCV